jgi:hypothetical protein
MPRSKNEWSYNSTPQYVFMEWCLNPGRFKIEDIETKNYMGR